MKLDKEKLEKVKKEAKDYYDSIGVVRCPYLDKDVHFRRDGFEHLLTKSWNRGRSIIEQYTRLRLLPKVVEILKKCHTLQEYDQRKIFVRQRVNSRWENRLKNVEYFVFVVILPEHDVRFKIVIKKIEGAEPFFWSNYPSWGIKKDYNGKDKKVFHSGNLEED